MAAKRGYKIIDPGRFDLPSGNYTAQIAAFKSAGAEIIAGVLPPPEFTAYISAASQQSLRPKIISVAKATEFPAAIAPLGDPARRACRSRCGGRRPALQVGLTGQTSQELTDAYREGDWQAGGR